MSVFQPYVEAGIMKSLKSELAKTAAPTVSDDTNSGYDVGSLWVDITNDRVYHAVDISAGAAIWKDLSAGDAAASIKTGSYTGDGATSQGITGVGFLPKYVKTWVREVTAGNSMVSYETTSDIIDDNAAGLTVRIGVSGTHSVQTNRIISLDADGFTVDDAGADSHPNQNSQIYNYLAIG